MDTFFREKLKVDVDYLNPFKSVEIGGRLDADKVAEDFYGLAEVIGLAMRKSASCLVEINLMPPALVEKKTFRRRIPFLAVGAVAILVGVALLGLSSASQLGHYETQRDAARKEKGKYKTPREEVAREVAAVAAVEKDIDAYADLIRRRTVVLKRIDSLRAAMLDGMWLVAVEPVGEEGVVTKLIVRGRGFVDKMRKVEEAAGSKLTAVEMLRDRLAAQPAFTNDIAAIDITQQSDAPGLAAKVKEFTLRVPLAPDCVFGKGGE
jgi:hypothetical protein